MKVAKKNAMAFIILIGIVSLFSDFTYEGARSIIGPYLEILGASAVAVGFISGLGEFIGYTLRLATGYISDKTKKYWTITIVGYSLNLLAIPALALIPADGWIYACGLIVLERFGKAIRNPAKSTLISFAATEVGVGKGFAIQEALDQIGAFLGPILLFAILTIKGHSDKYSAYVLCFLLLGIPAFIALSVLMIGKIKYPNPRMFEKNENANTQISLNKAYWYYIAAIAFIAAGFADFPLMAYHFSKKEIISDNFIPVLYAVAMGVDAISALFFGRLYDKIGLKAVIISSVISAFFALFAFLFDQPVMPVISVILWGIGMGAQESVLKATVASIVPPGKRGTAYGIFNTGFGIFWFLGSWLMGILYGLSIPWLVIFSIGIQLLSIPFFFKTRSLLKTQNN